MKKLLFVTCISIISACANNEDVKFTPPVVKADAEVASAAVEIAANATAKSFAYDKREKQASFAPPSEVQQQAIEKKIIKEGSISFETDNVSDTRKQMLASLKKLGGYVNTDNESINGENNRKEYTLDVRVPAKNFDSFLGSVSSAATKIDSKNISIRDVTTEYIDTKTRLDNKKILEKRYLALLDKAAKMSGVLEIENKLSEIRSDIESTQGQLNYMNKQVDYSSLSVTFYTKQAEQVATGNGFVYKLKQALNGGLAFLQSLFFGIIAVWPLWVVIFVVIVLLKRSRRKHNAN